jgi:hypothetical protein
VGATPKKDHNARYRPYPRSYLAALLRWYLEPLAGIFSPRHKRPAFRMGPPTRALLETAIDWIVRYPIFVTGDDRLGRVMGGVS